MLRERGAYVIEADAVGRELMEPGRAVYSAIVAHFGREVVQSDGQLDRKRLAELAFQQGRKRELTMLVHPAVIAAQEEWMQALFARHADAIAVVESALIFEAEREGTVPGWRKRFDKVVLITAPDAVKITRFVERAGATGEEQREALAADAKGRIAAQIPDQEKHELADIVIDNGASLEETERAVKKVWESLVESARGARLVPAEKDAL